ncbi:MAG: DUF4160 domain-containing protein [Methylococcales bacterium]
MPEISRFFRIIIKFTIKSRCVLRVAVIPAWMLESSHRDVFECAPSLASGLRHPCRNDVFLYIRIYYYKLTMYWNDHNPPHFHAQYGDYEAIIGLNGVIMEGKIPRSALSMVLAR